MATGRRASEGDSAAGIMAAVLRDEPEPARKAAPGLPAELERIIHRCLRKRPARRPQHVDDILLDLEELKQQYDSGWIRSASVSGSILRRFRQSAPRGHAHGPAQHLPEAALYTKIAVTADSLIDPVETRRSDLYLLDLPSPNKPRVRLKPVRRAGEPLRSPGWRENTRPAGRKAAAVHGAFRVR